jgi:S1-C subfamily serine protease
VPIRGAQSESAKLIGQDGVVALEGVIAFDEKHDLALVRAPIPAPSLSINEKTAAEIGETVFAVGNPEGLEGTFSQGIVSGIRNTLEGKWIQITAPISPGSSGGPVLNSKGEVLGIAVATLRSGQNLNFAIPAGVLSDLFSKTFEIRGFSALRLEPGSPQASGTERHPADHEGSDGSSSGEDKFSTQRGIQIHSI